MKHFTTSIATLLITLLFYSCSGNFEKVPDDKFVGLWEIQGRSMFEGIQIKIEKEDNHLIGRISKLNDNKFIKLFADTNDVWVSEINRTSNSEFKLIEKKLAKDLFALYGQPTSQEFKVKFLDDNSFGLATESSNPSVSKVIYKRVSGAQ